MVYRRIMYATLAIDTETNEVLKNREQWPPYGKSTQYDLLKMQLFAAGKTLTNLPIFNERRYQDSIKEIKVLRPTLVHL